MFDIKENLKKLPDAPGVYMHKDALGNIIYVGKARSLKNRVRQYFQSSKALDAKSRAMVSNIDSFEYIRCGSEMEALILENNLIKKHQPKYNILLRDDKTYPYIKITKEFWPRIEKTRQVLKDGAKYFGPYTDVGAVNSMIDLLNRVYKLKKCRRRTFPKGFKPCLNYYIEQCNGMCIGKESRSEYINRLSQIESFLKGKSKDLISFFEEEMRKASERLDYENAAIYRDYAANAKALMEKQRVVLKQGINMDVILLGQRKQIILFRVENGILSSREVFSIEFDEKTPRDKVLEAFIKQYYSNQIDGISELIVDEPINDRNLIEQFLEELWGFKVKINDEPKGEKKSLLELAKQDVVEMMSISTENEKNKKDKETKLSKVLNEIISNSNTRGNITEIVNSETGEIVELFDDKLKVEAYDISNTNGIDNVGVLVAFEGLNKLTSAYRKFKIKSVEGKADDYGSMAETVTRRIERALAGDKGFLPLPKIMLIDGGAGHIGVVKNIIDKYDVPVTVVGMIKDKKHRTDRLIYFSEAIEAINKNETPHLREVNLRAINDGNMLYSYIGNIQEEVHRFAIDYHRGLRSKAMVASELDNIKGIGPKKRSALLAHFGSVDKIKLASIDELSEVKGITSANASEIIKFYSNR